MRILYLTQYFQPEPLFWALPLAKQFQTLGHQVQVLTGIPHYPGNQFYEGYRLQWLGREQIDGIEVLRVPVYPSHDASAARRILCYSSLALAASTIGLCAADKPDVVYVMQGPITLGLPAWMFKVFKRAPFVLHIQDIWPDSLLSTGMFKSQVGLKMLHGFCRWVYRQAAKIIVISPGMKRLLVERGVPADKIEVVYNWADAAIQPTPPADPQMAETLGFAGKFNIVYAGNLGPAQALEAVINAAAILQTQTPAIQFVFVGDGVCKESLMQKAQGLGLKNVLFLPRRPANQMGVIFWLADVLLVHLKKDPLFAITVPSKTQAYLAAGKPILIGVEGDAAELVLRANAGVACQPQEPVSIAEAALQLYRMPAQQRTAMGENGAAFYREHLRFEIAAGKIEKVLCDGVQQSISSYD